MTSLRNRIRSRPLQRLALIVAALAAAWALLLLLFGGFDLALGGVSITTHNARRPLLVTAAAVLAFVLVGGDVVTPARAFGRAFLRIGAAALTFERFLPSPRLVAGALAIAVTITAAVYGSKAVGGSDSYGYMSEAMLWAKGALPRMSQPFVNDVPWPSRAWGFAPLGLRPASAFGFKDDQAEATLLPVCAIGFPLVMAGAKVVAGYQAMFFVVPLFAGVLVFSTYGIGTRLASPAAGLIGAWLVATSPAILLMMMATMSDVPVAGAWAAACYFLLGTTRRSAVAAGLCATVAIMIRPNLVPLAAVLGLRYLCLWFDVRRRRDAILDAVLFSLAALPGIVIVAVVNNALYGSPLISGYGTLHGDFSPSHIGPNVEHYFRWLRESQTVIAYVGLAALLVPARRLWPASAGRAPIVVAALFVSVVWTMFFIYNVYDAWWYLRFLLSSWPFIMIGTGAVCAALIRLRPRVIAPIVFVAVAWLGWHQVVVAKERSAFDLWAGERRYVVAAQMARRLTPQNSVIISGQHTGSLRLYAGRATFHYDYLDKDAADEEIAWLANHGAHPYLLIEDWEVTFVRDKFAGQAADAILDLPPLAIYREPGVLYLYDLVGRRAPDATPERVTGTYRDFWAAEPAPDVRQRFRE